MGYGALTTLASQQAFRVLLETLGAPGKAGALDVPAGVPAPLVMPLALADLTQRVAVVGADADRWDAMLADATACVRAAPGDADLVVTLHGAATPDLVASLRRGSPEAPEEGARVAIDCRFLGAGCQVTRRLSGPGVDQRIEMEVDGLGHDLLDAIAAANRQFPAGIDVWLIADDGACVGLPRTTLSEFDEVRPWGT